MIRPTQSLASALTLALALASASPAQTNTQWLDAAYQDLLGRPADAIAISTFVPPLDAHTLTRTQAALDILTGPECRQVDVGSYFQSFLNRTPNPGEVTPFVSAIAGGSTHEDIGALILGSTEYFTLHGATTGGFIDALFQDLLHRNVDPVSLTAFTTFLASHTDAQAATLLESFGEYRTVLVDDWYHRFLHRPSDAAAAAYVNALANSVRDENVIAAILGSDEYFSNAPAPGSLLTLAAATGLFAARSRRR